MVCISILCYTELFILRGTARYRPDDHSLIETVNPLATNDVYISRTAQLTSRRCILNIYSTNTRTEYFKHAAHSPFFSLQDAVYFIMLSFLVPVILTF